MNITKIIMPLALLFAALTYPTAYAQKNRSDAIVLPGAYIEFLEFPTSDTPNDGLMRVYPSGEKNTRRCDKCSRDYRYTKSLLAVIGGEANNIAMDSFSAIDDQLADVTISKAGLVIAIAFDEILRRSDDQNSPQPNQ